MSRQDIVNESVEDCLCVVVAVGCLACSALGEIDRATSRYWTSIAIGGNASRAKADRTIHVKDDAIAREWLPAVLSSLEEAWRDALAVYVVFDQHEHDERAIALQILEHARGAERASVAALLGPTQPWIRQPREGVCDMVLRLADGGDYDDERHRPADALRGLLTPFEVGCAPGDLFSIPKRWSEIADARVVTSRSRGRRIDEAVHALLREHDVLQPHHVHVMLGEGVQGLLRLRDTFVGRAREEIELYATISDDLQADELVVAAIAPVARCCRSSVALHLRGLVADLAGQRLPRGAFARDYAALLVRELCWWTANDARGRALLELRECVTELRAHGHVVGPSLRGPGGSLVAYVLGLSAFDPVRWDLPFDTFAHANERDVLTIEVSRAALDATRALALPVERRWALAPSPPLDVIERLGLGADGWCAEASADANALMLLWRADGRAYVPDAYRGHRAALATLAPASLRDLAAAVELLGTNVTPREVLDAWLAKRDTPPFSIEQVVDALWDTLRMAQPQADRLRRRLRAYGDPGDRGREAEAFIERVADTWIESERMAEKLHQAVALIWFAGCQSHALSTALVWLTVLRSQLSSSRGRHAHGAYAVRLLRRVTDPCSAVGVELPEGLELVAEIHGRDVRLSSDVLPGGSIVAELREGVDFEVVDARRGGQCGDR